MSYAFTFDATFCSGCKACQAACKDKNNLPLGVLWRRVVEVSGGDWQQNGEAWNNTVFTYNLSIACNHCVHPKCAGICPTNAYVVREDGIVILDTSKCMGCGYCAWACPYGAPQYNAEAGYMTKCNFCFDNLEQGLPPACVAACPMRVLDYGEMRTAPASAANEIRLWEAPSETHPFPLPGRSHTQPRLAIKQHAAMHVSEEKSVANVEEIQSRLSGWEEVPLILFTLLTQMAVGGFWTMLWMFPQTWAVVQHDATLLRLLPNLLVGMCLGAGMIASLAHLGTKSKAVLALRNIRRSWLSREILFTGLFAISWLATTLKSAIWHHSTIELSALTATLGFGLVYSMAKVYRLPAVPAWNKWRTNAVFIASAFLLGQSAMTILLVSESTLTGIPLPPVQRMIISMSILILLFIQLFLMRRPSSQHPLHKARIALIVLGISLTAMATLLFGSMIIWVSIFLIILLQEGTGRWSFYQARAPWFAR